MPTPTLTKPRGVVFRDWQIKALCEGRLSQFRVPIIHQGRPLGDFAFYEVDGDVVRTESGRRKKPPYKPGDVLFVQEPWAIRDCGSKVSIVAGELTMRHRLQYLFTDTAPATTGKAKRPYWWNKRPARSMPAWASRFSLTVKGVKVARVQEATPDDVFAEGMQQCVYRHGSTPHIAFCDDGPEVFVPDPAMPEGGRVHAPIGGYHEMFDRSLGPGEWEENPWTWVVTVEPRKEQNA